MKNRTIVILVSALLICISIGAMAQDDYKKIQEARINSLITAVNSADEAKIREFLSENWQEDKEKMEKRISTMAGTKDQFGEMVLKTIEYDSKEVCIASIECNYNVIMTIDFLPENNFMIKTVKLEALPK